MLNLHLSISQCSSHVNPAAYRLVLLRSTYGPHTDLFSYAHVRKYFVGLHKKFLKYPYEKLFSEVGDLNVRNQDFHEP